MKTLTKTLLASSLGLVLATQAAAAPLANGSFAAGLSGWTLVGDGIAEESLPGQWNAIITNAYNDGQDDPTNFNLSGAQVATADQVEAAAGLTPLALGDTATEGSVLKQTFDVQAGDMLTFHWGFTPFDGTVPDLAFVAIQEGAATTSLSVLADGGIGASGNFSRSFAAAATVTLSVGVVDRDDTYGSSWLAISNVLVNPVPEPESYTLLLAGLALVGGLARRKAAGQ
jgi:hypothetical protein